MSASTGGDPFGLVGQVLDGQFRIDGLVGEGGFSAVYKGHNVGLGEPIAIKCLKLPPMIGAQLVDTFIQRFRDESRILYRLSQGNLHIVRSIGAGTTRVPRTGALVPYMILEWLEGRSLANDLTARRTEGRTGRTLQEIVELFGTAADALAFAHKQGVVHRDLNPGNFFLTDTAQGVTTKVLDFGVAKVMHDSTLGLGDRAPTMAHVRIFAPAYGAPEQFDDGLGAIGPWTDVYAFALVLLEVLRDRTVNEGENLVDFAGAAIDANRRPAPRLLGIPASDEIESVFVRATKLDPRERWPNVAEFWRALVLASSATTASTANAAVASASIDKGQNARTMPLGSPNMPRPAPRPAAGGPATQRFPNKSEPDNMPPANPPGPPLPPIDDQPEEEVTQIRAPEPEMLATLQGASAPTKPPAPIPAAGAPPPKPLPAAGAPAPAPERPKPPSRPPASLGGTMMMGNAPRPAVPRAPMPPLPMPPRPASNRPPPAGPTPARPAAAFASTVAMGSAPDRPKPPSNPPPSLGGTMAMNNAPVPAPAPAVLGTADTEIPETPTRAGAPAPLPANMPPLPPPPAQEEESPADAEGSTVAMAAPAVQAPLGGPGQEMPSPLGMPNQPLPMAPPSPLGMPPQPQSLGLGPPMQPQHQIQQPMQPMQQPMQSMQQPMQSMQQPMQQSGTHPGMQGMQPPSHGMQGMQSAPSFGGPSPGYALAAEPLPQAPKKGGNALVFVAVGAAAFLFVGGLGLFFALRLRAPAAPPLMASASAPAVTSVAPPPTTPPPVAVASADPPPAVSAEPEPSASAEPAPSAAAAEPTPSATAAATAATAAVTAATTTSVPAWTAPTTTASANPAPSADPNAFSESAARAKLAQASGVLVFCKKTDGVTGPGHAMVTFANDGTVSGVVLEPPYAGTKEGDCATGHFKRAKVNAFEGPPKTIRHAFEIPK